MRWVSEWKDAFTYVVVREYHPSKTMQVISWSERGDGKPNAKMYFFFNLGKGQREHGQIHPTYNWVQPDVPAIFSDLPLNRLKL